MSPPVSRPSLRPSGAFRASRLLLVACAAVLAAQSAGCGSSASQGPDPAAAIASIDARLRGGFRLVRFEPEVPLEPMLASMLEFQYAHLIVRFDGKRILADSPGLHVDRAYEIRDPAWDRFKLISYDEAGIGYEALCEFSEQGELIVHAQTPPWKGVATLRRAQ
ncbi:MULTISPECIES: hypothetical protein [Sorangium]|uniref:Secreted protein n=1 Tax=Sorangium cellulosum TaxID=56 RepID=A0A4P2QUV3_SORCE|nr:MULTISPECIES: hypothetical protein [Sorangium]AUX33918.1 hypothetical protein SOCE836_060850 [Sorangium cellulosum]WCQ93228.1 hypothetical protein NQZ70_05976 [Sorangium sp. Soce836]